MKNEVNFSQIPPYFRMNSRVFLDVSDGKPREKSQFVDDIRKIFDQNLEGTYTGEFSNDVNGRRLEAVGTMIKQGFLAYGSHVKALPNGKPSAKPYGEPNGDISNSKSDEEQKRQESDLLRERLQEQGYTDTEIDEALLKLNDQIRKGNRIENKAAYAAEIVDQLRKKGGAHVSHNYQQRTYTDRTTELIKGVLAEAEGINEKQEERFERGAGTC